MSAFMVSDECMNSALQAFDPSRNRDQRSYGYSGSEAMDQLGRELFAMNSRALRDRYGDPEEKPEDFAEFRYTPKQTSPVAVYKSLGCLIYQCSEGKVPEEAQFKMLTDRYDQMAHEIAGQHKDYEDAPWG